MKKLLAFLILTVGLASCSVFDSLSSSDVERISYFSAQVVITSVNFEKTSVNLVNAVKAKNYDSVIIYGLQLDSLYQAGLSYKDSIAFYTKK